MKLSDMPPSDQDEYLDGFNAGLTAREAGLAAMAKHKFDPSHGAEAGWLWRRGFDAGIEGVSVAEDLARIVTGPQP